MLFFWCFAHSIDSSDSFRRFFFGECLVLFCCHCPSVFTVGRLWRWSTLALSWWTGRGLWWDAGAAMDGVLMAAIRALSSMEASLWSSFSSPSSVRANQRSAASATWGAVGVSTSMSASWLVSKRSTISFMCTLTGPLKAARQQLCWWMRRQKWWKKVWLQSWQRWGRSWLLWRRRCSFRWMYWVNLVLHILHW